MQLFVTFAQVLENLQATASVGLQGSLIVSGAVCWM